MCEPAVRAAAEASTTVPSTKTSSKCGLTPSSCQTFKAYEGLPGPANSQSDSRIEFTASPRAAPVTDALRNEIALGVAPTEWEKKSINFSVRSSAFSWNPNGVSKIVSLRWSSLPIEARICWCWVTIVGLVSPDPITTICLATAKSSHFWGNCSPSGIFALGVVYLSM